MLAADEPKCRDIFTAVENLCEWFLKIDDVRLETVSLSHFDSEEVVIILVGF